MYVDIFNWKAKYWRAYIVLPFVNWQQKELWGLGQEGDLLFITTFGLKKKLNEEYKLPSVKMEKKLIKQHVKNKTLKKYP